MYWSPEQNLWLLHIVNHCRPLLLKRFAKPFSFIWRGYALGTRFATTNRYWRPKCQFEIEQDLSSQIMNGYGVSFLNIGTCILHETHSHNVFWRSVFDFGLDIEIFAFETIYLFKPSAVNRKYYEMMQFFPDIETKLLRILEKLDNLFEYFIKSFQGK